MNKEEITKSITKHAAITADELAYFFNHARYIKVSRNQCITKAGDTEIYFVLIMSGCLMTYVEDERKQKHVLQFGTDMWWTGDLEAFTQNKPSSYFIKSLTEVEAYLISTSFYAELVNKIPEFNRYFRIIFQNALISHQRRIIRDISYSGEEKYLEFLKFYPKIEMMVPQKYIASYLGITPEFLSKIRRKLAGK